MGIRPRPFDVQLVPTAGVCNGLKHAAKTRLITAGASTSISNEGYHDVFLVLLIEPGVGGMQQSWPVRKGTLLGIGFEVPQRQSRNTREAGNQWSSWYMRAMLTHPHPSSGCVFVRSYVLECGSIVGHAGSWAKSPLSKNILNFLTELRSQILVVSVVVLGYFYALFLYLRLYYLQYSRAGG